MLQKMDYNKSIEYFECDKLTQARTCLAKYVIGIFVAQAITVGNQCEAIAKLHGKSVVDQCLHY